MTLTRRQHANPVVLLAAGLFTISDTFSELSCLVAEELPVVLVWTLPTVDQVASSVVGSGAIG